MYQVGWDKQQIKITPKGYAMFGYGQWSHRAYEQRTALFARSLSIVDQQHRLIICCLDLGCITHAIRSQTVARLTQILDSHLMKINWSSWQPILTQDLAVVAMKLYTICRPLVLCLNI
jgi:hypothetical protein